jgi:hypothetical protein
VTADQLIGQHLPGAGALDEIISGPRNIQQTFAITSRTTGTMRPRPVSIASVMWTSSNWRMTPAVSSSRALTSETGAALRHDHHQQIVVAEVEAQFFGEPRFELLRSAANSPSTSAVSVTGAVTDGSRASGAHNGADAVIGVSANVLTARQEQVPAQTRSHRRRLAHPLTRFLAHSLTRFFACSLVRYFPHPPS